MYLFRRSRVRALRLSIMVGLALLLAAFSWVGAAVTPVTSSSGSEAGSGRSVADASAITIGVGASLTVVPEIGWRQVNAVQLAVDQANAAGGINIGGTTYTLGLVTADDGCNATQGAVAANTLIGAGAVAVVGYTCTSASTGAQPVHGAAHVAMVSPSSTGPNLTEQGYDTTFRVAAREDSAAGALAASFRNRLDLDKVAIVEFGGSPAYAADVFASTFTSLGGTISSRRTVKSTADFTAALTDIKHNDAPDAIFYVDGDAAQAGEFSHISNDVVGMTDVPIGWDPLTDDTAVLAAYAAAAGAAAEGDYATMHGLRTQDMARYDEFNAIYQAAGFPNYGDEATIVAPYAYDAANILINAIVFAQSTDPGDIRDAIAGTANYSGIVGVYEGFDAKGDVIPQWHLLMRYANGQWSKLYPRQIFLPMVVKGLAP